MQKMDDKQKLPTGIRWAVLNWIQYAFKFL